MCHTVSLLFWWSHASFFIPRDFTNVVKTVYENKHRQHIQMLLKDTILVYMINKNKAGSCSSPSLRWALLFIILVKTHNDKPFQCKQSYSLKIAEIYTAKYNRQFSSKQILKYYGSFPYRQFLSMEIFLLKFQIRSCKLWQYPPSKPMPPIRHPPHIWKTNSCIETWNTISWNDS